MAFFISNAYASTAHPAQGDGMYSIFMIAIIFVLFYFMLIRPQNQRLKTQRQMLEALKKGDEVVIGGGIMGRITQINDQHIKLLITENCEISVQRQAVSSVLPKGTLKTI
ncbi:MAG: preprotein translocase subunit YajC [Legionellales bacterium RIFCSPHIGHO2_12_FULL_37_14]|nr:MAG: preprotein translocase subunit YajC [Legionellales bacterium RIFCSPHIGHO2_12_FULL_37_14]